MELQILVADDLFAYLCVHGSSSAWFRLKWIADLAAWQRRMNTSEVERLYVNAMQPRAHRAAGKALLPGDGLDLLTLAREFNDRLTADQPSHGPARTAGRQLFAPTEPTERSLGTAAIHFSQLAVQPGWRLMRQNALASCATCCEWASHDQLVPSQNVH